MATITEDYVSFEIAKLLKEKRFDEHCFCVNYPLPEGGHHSIILPNLLNNSIIPFIDEYKFCRYKEDFITIPTLQMAMKWLREVHNIYITINYSVFLYGTHPYYWNIDKMEDAPRANSQIEISTNTLDYSFINYEQACESAIKYCLENLI